MYFLIHHVYLPLPPIRHIKVYDITKTRLFSFVFFFIPFAELELATENVIEMNDSQTILKYPATLDKMER